MESWCLYFRPYGVQVVFGYFYESDTYTIFGWCVWLGEDQRTNKHHEDMCLKENGLSSKFYKLFHTQ